MLKWSTPDLKMTFRTIKSIPSPIIHKLYTNKKKLSNGFEENIQKVAKYNVPKNLTFVSPSGHEQ